MTKHHKQEVPSNVVATAAMTERILSKTGFALHSTDHRLDSMIDEGIVIKQISLKASAGPRGEWLAVVTADTENGSIVAFHSSEGFTTVVEGVCNRLINGSLKWREDQYAK